ncbi:hypothetical protein EOD41_17665 [Mucilaginibacter limnophilus]|uniref:Peptidyl-prolyl cis-trans isomerase n=1 Tax=Mucilaginibacter limnophilus TaxID=1932778 RepID=A0A437MKP9_9SPHI|nr:FKBP-type peptidyl-prolyl cis-trans isomerase [Mucilaginibacter limnophilus]RVT98199.1 hypothetical protein EOD41_17665 [Mucilaginibacter limnophilus]
MKRVLVAILFITVALQACKKTLVGEERYREQAAKDDAIIQQYIVDNNLQDSVQRIDTSGVYYIIRKPGSGNDVYTNSTRVTVGFTTRVLTTGQLIFQTDQFHPTYSLGSNIIRAWQLGIPQVQEGGVVRILSPSRYAYGPYPQPSLGLPADAILDFEITVYNIQN